jgi:adenine-specific DNA-methyltransferase
MIESTFEDAFSKIQELATTFKANESRYLSAAYQEAEVRKDFIDKLWIALGWDVNHDWQTNPYEQEVKVEPGVTIGAGQRRADYAFYLAPNFRDPRFYVEAKKPYGDIATADNYFQTIRYGWNSQTPFAVLTDFKQFHVLDCRYKPDVMTGLYRAVGAYNYADFGNREKFAQIYWLFSHEAVAAGSLEKRAAELPKPRGKAVQRGLFPGAYKAVDESFLNELDEFRTILAHAFKEKNPRLESDALTEIVQRTVDRLVFLRFLEDRGIEANRLVDSFGNTGSAWEDFVAASKRLDAIYNGIVFKRHDLLDSPKFRVDEDIFADICERLAAVNTPYDFNSIPIHILGSIYERFLGKVILATGKRVRVEEKPEVRKAGGVYYTPEHVVRYITGNTVGRLITGKTPAEIAGMRFADIACGSGSFLLGIYDLLLDYHGNYYNQNASKARKGECIQRDGKLYLSLSKKREILLNNIYGVDIDAQAVEVAQLSLYLRLLQEETTGTAHQYLLDFAQTARMKTLLPDLSKNIVCGNSLVGMDILEGQLFAGEEERKLNAMDFKDAFPEIMKSGGFDAVVGNPPYGADLSDAAKAYIREQFRSYKYKYDSYIYFIERALKIAKKGGYVSYITPEVWLRLENCAPLRKLIAQNAGFRSLRVYGENVFEQAVVNTVVFVLQKGTDVESIRIEDGLETWEVSTAKWKADPLFAVEYRLRPDASALVVRIKARSCQLAQFGDAIQGITPYDRYTGQSAALIERRGYHFKHKQDKHCGKWLAGEDIARYELHWSGEWLRYGPWLGAPREPRFFEGPRLLFREIPGEGKRIQATLVLKETLYHGHSITPFRVHESCTVDIRFLLGVVNSRVISWFANLVLSNFGKEVFPKLNPQDVKTLPIPNIDMKNSTDRAQHDQMVRWVDSMLEAREQLAKVKTDKDKAYYTNKCVGLDRQIDQLAYSLYALTEEEIRSVERAIGAHGGWPGAFRGEAAAPSGDSQRLLKAAEPRPEYGSGESREKQ